MAERRRNLVVREDGRRVNVARSRGQLFVCATGAVADALTMGAPVPTDLYHTEWERRRFRNVVHLTVGGCLGPCALANVALLIFDGQALWFHSVNSEALVRALYDHIEAYAGTPTPAFAGAARARRNSVHGFHLATASRWPARWTTIGPAACRLWRHPRPRARRRRPWSTRTRQTRAYTAPRSISPGRPRCRAGNGELVFDAPWQGRVFGMAVALSETRGVRVE